MQVTTLKLVKRLGCDRHEVRNDFLYPLFG
jgi:hypothetical protein